MAPDYETWTDINIPLMCTPGLLGSELYYQDPENNNVVPVWTDSNVIVKRNMIQRVVRACDNFVRLGVSGGQSHQCNEIGGLNCFSLNQILA
jgi:hypothetical protein